MQFGLLLNWHMPVGVSTDSDAGCFAGIVEQVRLAEVLGFSCVWPLVGDAQRWIEVAQACADTGVDRLLCHFPTRRGTSGTSGEAMRRFADDVIPAFA
jgi:hypothetical protein